MNDSTKEAISYAAATVGSVVVGRVVAGALTTVFSSVAGKGVGEDYKQAITAAGAFAGSYVSGKVIYKFTRALLG